MSGQRSSSAMVGLYEASLDYDEPWWHDGDPAWSAGFEYGAAVAFGLLGMAEAIRRTHLGVIGDLVLGPPLRPNLHLDQDQQT